MEEDDAHLLCEGRALRLEELVAPAQPDQQVNFPIIGGNSILWKHVGWSSIALGLVVGGESSLLCPLSSAWVLDSGCMLFSADGQIAGTNLLAGVV